MKRTPLYQYFDNPEAMCRENTAGTYRVLRKDGRAGIHTPSIHSSVEIHDHNLNADMGSVTVWIMALEDLGTMAHHSEFAVSNPYYMNYRILSDCRTSGDLDHAAFSMVWSNTWYPQLYAKFCKGQVYPDAYNPREMAFVAAGHFELRKGQWYQLCFSWNKREHVYRLYMNGILVGVSNSLTKGLAYETVGDTLYVGNPCMCIADLAFYSEFADEKEAAARYVDEAIVVDDALQTSIKKMFQADDLEPFHWQPDETWEERLNLTLLEEEHLHHFYVQGCHSAPSITDEGLLVETPQNVPRHGRGTEPDMDQVYLWTDRCFEGDLYLEFEFMSLKEGGLALLMVQASGMQREDFMSDYPLRTNGSMKTVTSEDVRNYHWEFYREMNDVRNDVSSHVIVKNPWLHPMGYVCKTGRPEKESVA